MNLRFKDKTVIVTGAGSGIGKATALRLAVEGARVIAADVRADRLDELLTDLAGAHHATVAGDIADAAIVDTIIDVAGPHVDVLVNNAGIMDGFLPAAEVDDETWARVFAVNVTAPMRLMRAVLPGMIAAGAGTIVNVASEAALRGACAGAAYTASKAALIGLTKNTAFMYAPSGIRCNAVAPGAVATNIEALFRSELAQQRLLPVFGAITPPAAQSDQLAAAIAWLASDDSPNITGVVLASDGGWSAI